MAKKVKKYFANARFNDGELNDLLLYKDDEYPAEDVSEERLEFLLKNQDALGGIPAIYTDMVEDDEVEEEEEPEKKKVVKVDKSKK